MKKVTMFFVMLVAIAAIHNNDADAQAAKAKARNEELGWSFLKSKDLTVQVFINTAVPALLSWKDDEVEASRFWHQPKNFSYERIRKFFIRGVLRTDEVPEDEILAIMDRPDINGIITKTLKTFVMYTVDSASFFGKGKHLTYAMKESTSAFVGYPLVHRPVDYLLCKNVGASHVKYGISLICGNLAAPDFDPGVAEEGDTTHSQKKVGNVGTIVGRLRNNFSSQELYGELRASTNGNGSVPQTLNQTQITYGAQAPVVYDNAPSVVCLPRARGYYCEPYRQRCVQPAFSWGSNQPLAQPRMMVRNEPYRSVMQNYPSGRNSGGNFITGGTKNLGFANSNGGLNTGRTKNLGW